MLRGSDDNVYLADFGISEMLHRTAAPPPTAEEVRATALEVSSLQQEELGSFSCTESSISIQRTISSSSMAQPSSGRATVREGVGAEATASGESESEGVQPFCSSFVDGAGSLASQMDIGMGDYQEV